MKWSEEWTWRDALIWFFAPSLALLHKRQRLGKAVGPEEEKTIEGYQPDHGDLDPSSPPHGGSGVSK